MTANDVATLLSAVGAIGAWGFFIHYTITLRWWRSLVGRQIAASTLAMALFSTTIASIRLIGRWEGVTFLILATYGFVAVTAFSFWFVFIRERRAAKRELYKNIDNNRL